MKTIQNCSGCRHKWVKNTLRRFVPLEGVIELKTEKELTTLKHNDQEVVFSSKPEQRVPNTKATLSSFEGNRAYYVSSDVLEVNNILCNLKPIEKHTAYRIIENIIRESLPFLEWVSQNEGTAIIIQINVELESDTLNVTAGLENDIQVSLLEITPNTKATTYV